MTERQDMEFHRAQEYRTPDEEAIDAGFWTTAIGTRLRIEEMGDGHLRNTIRFLGRQIADAEASLRAVRSIVFTSEDAEYEAERDEQTLEAAVEGMTAKRAELSAEMAAREARRAVTGRG